MHKCKTLMHTQCNVEWKRQPEGNSPVPVDGCLYGTYSYKAERESLHLNPLAILRTP